MSGRQARVPRLDLRGMAATPPATAASAFTFGALSGSDSDSGPASRQPRNSRSHGRQGHARDRRPDPQRERAARASQRASAPSRGAPRPEGGRAGRKTGGVVGHDVGERLVTKLEAALGELGPEAIIQLLGSASGGGHARTGRNEDGRSRTGRDRVGRPLDRQRASRHSRGPPRGRGGARLSRAVTRGQARDSPRGRHRRGDWSSSDASAESGSSDSRVDAESSDSSSGSIGSSSGGSSRGSSRDGGGVRRSTGPGASRDKRAAERRLAEARALALRAERANPTGDAVADMALWLGLDPAGEADEAAMWVAEEALTAPLPQGWETATVPLPAAPLPARRGTQVGAARAAPQAPGSVAYFYRVDDDGQAIAGSSQWEHPLDGYYRALARRAKEELGPAVQASAATPRQAQPPQPPPQARASAALRPPTRPPALPVVARTPEATPPTPPPPMLGGGLRHSPPRTTVVPPNYDPSAIDRLAADATASGKAGPRRSVLSRVASAAGAAVSAASAAVTSFVAPPRAQAGDAARQSSAALPATAGRRTGGDAAGVGPGAAPPSTPPRGRTAPPLGGSPSRVAPAQAVLCMDDSPQRQDPSRASLPRSTGPTAAGGTATRIEVMPGSRSLDRPSVPSPEAGATTIVPAGAGEGPLSHRLASLLRLPAYVDPLLGGVSHRSNAPGLLRAGRAGRPVPLPSPRPSWRLIAALERSSSAASPPHQPAPATLPRFPRHRRSRASSVEMDASASATDVIARLVVPPSTAFSSRTGPDPRRAPVMAEEISAMCLHLGLCPASLARAGALWLVRAALLSVPPPAWAVVAQDEAASGGAVFAHRGTSDVVGLHPVDSLLLPLLRAAEASGRPPRNGTSRSASEQMGATCGVTGAWALCPESSVSRGGLVAAKGHAGVLHSCVGSQLVLAAAPAVPRPITWELVPAHGRWPRALLQGGGPAGRTHSLSVDVSAVDPPSKLPPLSAPAGRLRLHRGFNFGSSTPSSTPVAASRGETSPPLRDGRGAADTDLAVTSAPAENAGAALAATPQHHQSAATPAALGDTATQTASVRAQDGSASATEASPGPPAGNAPHAPRGAPPPSRWSGATSARRPRGPPPRGPPPGFAPKGRPPEGPSPTAPRALLPAGTAPTPESDMRAGSSGPAPNRPPAPPGPPAGAPPLPLPAAPAPAGPPPVPAESSLSAPPRAPGLPREQGGPLRALPAITEVGCTSSSSNTPTTEAPSNPDRAAAPEHQLSPSGASTGQPAPCLQTGSAEASPRSAAERHPPRPGGAEPGAAVSSPAGEGAAQGDGQQVSTAPTIGADAGSAAAAVGGRVLADGEPGSDAESTRSTGSHSEPATATVLFAEEPPSLARAAATGAAPGSHRVGGLVPVVLVSRGVPRQAVACGATLERPVPAADPDAWIQGVCSPADAALCRTAVLRRYAQAVGIVAPLGGGFAQAAARRQDGLPPPPPPPASARHRSGAAAASAPPRPPPTSARASAPAGELWSREALEALPLGDLGALERVLSTLVQWQSQALVAATARRDQAQESAHDAAMRARQVLASHRSHHG